MIRRIDENISVAPQIPPELLPEIAAQGFAVVVNNRPDGEEPGQPESAEIARAAAEAGLGYVEIPVAHAGISSAQVEAMAAALAAAPGPVLAFCRSGTRSCNLWALASASLKQGDAEALIGKAAGAGYDISGLRPMLDTLSGRP